MPTLPSKYFSHVKILLGGYFPIFAIASRENTHVEKQKWGNNSPKHYFSMGKWLSSLTPT